MGYAIKIYEAFRDLGEDKASILAEFVEHMESQKAATSGELKQTELKLQGEIEKVRKEIKETELRLQGEIEKVRKEIKEIELRLQKEIKQVELRLQKEIGETKASLIKWMFAFWISQFVGIVGIFIKLLG